MLFRSGGWPEIYFHWTPIDDENHWWFITSRLPLAGTDAEAFIAKRAEFRARIAAAPPGASSACCTGSAII